VPNEKLLASIICDNRSQTEKRQSVDLRIFQVDSTADAKLCLGPGKVASGWKIEKFEIGDEELLGRVQE
jgi:hypothetical protein